MNYFITNHILNDNFDLVALRHLLYASGCYSIFMSEDILYN